MRGQYTYPDASVLDDRIGTIKIWRPAYTNEPIPPGWREYADLSGRFPVGRVKSGDPDFVLNATGGAKTHTHGTTTGSGAGTGTVTLAAANHLPPYRAVRFIERYQ